MSDRERHNQGAGSWNKRLYLASRNIAGRSGKPAVSGHVDSPVDGLLIRARFLQETLNKGGSAKLSHKIQILFSGFRK